MPLDYKKLYEAAKGNAEHWAMAYKDLREAVLSVLGKMENPRNIALQDHGERGKAFRELYELLK